MKQGVEWPTPAWLVRMLAAEFGPFTLDPAATAENAHAPVFYDEAADGLSRPWHGRVWLNPPYGRTIGVWLAKARAEVASGRADLVVCLVPASVDSRWWRDASASASLVRFWPGRIAFGGGRPAPFPSAVVVFGVLTGRHGTSHKRCRVCDRVFWPARSDAATCSTRCRKAKSRTLKNSNARAAVRTLAPLSIED